MTQTLTWLDGTRLAYPLLYSAANNIGPSVSLSIIRRKHGKTTNLINWHFLTEVTVQTNINESVCLFLIISHVYEFIVTDMDCNVSITSQYVCHNKGAKIENGVKMKITEVACAPGQFQCQDKSCILDIYICDGQTDCSNNEDEYGDLCQRNRHLFFNCDINQYIPLSFICNGEKQCLNGEDEYNCFPENQNKYHKQTMLDRRIHNAKHIPQITQNCLCVMSLAFYMLI